MEKLKTIAKSIWAKIPKTKTEFKDLFDKCVSFLKHWLHKIWAFLKSAYAWVINFYQKHSKLIHKCLHGGLILFLAGLLCLWVYGFIILSLDFLDLYKDPTQEAWSSQLRMAAFILVAWFGAPFLVWRTWIASKQANTAQEKAYTELFTQAIEQLGSEKPEANAIKDKNGEPILDEAGRPLTEEKYVPNIEVRVGALYALERIMHDSDKDAKTIIDTLCTYVKHNCGKPKDFEDEISKTELEKLSEDKIKTKREKFIETLKEDPPADRYDIQTALTIIGRRPGKYKTEETMPDLSNVNLQGADLVNFDLSHCKLNNAHIDGANLHGANLHGAKLHGANLQRAKLQWANLQEAKLQRAKLHGANLQRANLQRANLQWANLQEAKLQRAKLHGANLQRANLHGANLQRANLQWANLQWANLQEANLQWANLQEAKLQRANLQNVQITDAHKTAASVIWVDFTKAKYDFDILQEQVKNMFGHKILTILPEDMKVPDHWSEADMDTAGGRRQYNRDWEAFKKEKGVE